MHYKSNLSRTFVYPECIVKRNAKKKVSDLVSNIMLYERDLRSCYSQLSVDPPGGSTLGEAGFVRTFVRMYVSTNFIGL